MKEKLEEFNETRGKPDMQAGRGEDIAMEITMQREIR
jgi:hypothetical protein